MANYGDNSIKTLKDEQQVRQRPSVIFGTNDESGAAHGIYEIIANSIDEAREGYGDTIDLKIWNNGEVEVSDRGRGVPMDWNQAEGKYNWELVFCTLYASGKYDSSSYGQSLGLNGLGATAMQYASEFFDVESIYDGKSHIMHFKKGKPVGKMEVKAATRAGTGTTIKFKPDPDVFIGIRNKCMPATYYLDILRRQAMLHPGLKFNLWHEEVGEAIEIVYPDGPIGFIDSILEKSMLKKTMTFTDSDEGTDDPIKVPETYKVDMRLTFNFTRDENRNFIELYHNGSHLFEGGLTMKSLTEGFVAAFEEYTKEIGKLPRTEHLSFKDIQCILSCVASTDAPGNRTYFKNQTKGAINNPFIYQCFKIFIYDKVYSWLKGDKAQSDRVVAEVLANKQAREEADKVTRKVIQTLNKTISMGNKPRKFVDCRSKNAFERELYIVEGDSAAGACKLSRDAGFQAIMPVRGKIMNCLKEEPSRILNSEIIVDLIRIFGCGVELKSKYIENLPKFDISKFGWNKIIICTDADVDGMQIRCLVITMLYRMCPTLLKEGKVFIAETPLFEITCKKETKFAYSDAERDTIINQFKLLGYKDNQIKVQRSKGLGENDPDMMNKTTMNPATRRLVSIEYPENDEMLKVTINALLGDDIEMRRFMIDEYFNKFAAAGE